MKTLEKILIHRDYKAIEKETRAIENIFPYVEHAVNIFNDLGIGVLTTEELPLLVGNNPLLLFDIHVDRKEPMPINDGFFPKSKAKYLKTLDLPDSAEFLSAAIKLRNLIIYKGPDISYFEIADDKAVISKTKIQELENLYSKYAESDIEVALYNKLIDLHKIMSEIDDHYYSFTGKHPFKTDRTRFGESIASNFIKGVPDPNNGFKPVIGVVPNFQLIIDLQKELTTTN